MECTALRPAGHYHPDMTSGRCLNFLGPEELRNFYNWKTAPHKTNYTKKHRPVEVGCERVLDGSKESLLNCRRLGTEPGGVIGPVGWHLMQFQTSYEILNNEAMDPTIERSETLRLDILKNKVECKYGDVGIFKIDALGCMPLPHAFKTQPLQWQHYLKHESDESYPDPFILQDTIKHR
eukprot:CAMPEP_0196583376 /NCGR_PEP_ID=MMETSP1081-20130531/43299_1 /TAXON_ID=36882 /ORGANISM="Pyramimonas amylifera, Strain CCMP720" /LENGTH=178 /DNA_ID=CAMNT_0041904245 /DNA_START=63 /DNA_END=596 /DNA_ORIENTATION=+